MTTKRLTLIILLSALLYALWRLANEGTDRVPVRPASPSVSFEHMLDEMDDEQRRWMEEEGEL